MLQMHDLLLFNKLTFGLYDFRKALCDREGERAYIVYDPKYFN